MHLNPTKIWQQLECNLFEFSTCWIHPNWIHLNGTTHVSIRFTSNVVVFVLFGIFFRFLEPSFIPVITDSGSVFLSFFFSLQIVVDWYISDHPRMKFHQMYYNIGGFAISFPSSPSLPLPYFSVFFYSAFNSFFSEAKTFFFNTLWRCWFNTKMPHLIVKKHAVWRLYWITIFVWVRVRVYVCGVCSLGYLYIFEFLDIHRSSIEQK